MIELERRWKLKEPPPEEIVTLRYTIYQAYINTSKGIKTRIRKSVSNSDTWFSHCTKYYIGENAREEFEVLMDENQFNLILSLYPSVTMEIKNRTVVTLPEGGTIVEIDEYQNGDVVVEVEFYDLEVMKSFIPPTWFGEEIKDKKFSVKSIW